MKIEMYQSMTQAMQKLSSIAISSGSSSNVGNNGNTGNHGNNNNMSSSGSNGMSVSANNITINCMFNLWEAKRSSIANTQEFETVNRAVYRCSNELFEHFKRWKDSKLTNEEILANLINVASTYDNTEAKK